TLRLTRGWRTLLRALVAAVAVVGTALSAALSTAAATATSAAITTTDELEILHDDGDLGALSAALLVFPLVELEPALDEDRLALGHVLVDHLRLLSEGGDVDEGDLLAVLAGGGAVLAIGRKSELGDGRVGAGDVLELRVAREVAHEQHSVKAGHGL